MACSTCDMEAGCPPSDNPHQWTRRLWMLDQAMRLAKLQAAKLKEATRIVLQQSSQYDWALTIKLWCCD